MPQFEIFALPVHGGGELALSPIPGCNDDFPGDLKILMDWAPSLVITMTTSAEMQTAGATDLPRRLAIADIKWLHLPIVDFGAPDGVVQQLWPAVSQQARALLQAGKRVLVHCKGGRGRSGMVVLRLMVEAGEDPKSALTRLRHTRTGAVETLAQQAWALAV